MHKPGKKPNKGTATSGAAVPAAPAGEKAAAPGVEKATKPTPLRHRLAAPFCAALATALFLLLSFAAVGLYPFGQNALAGEEAYNTLLPFLAQLKQGWLLIGQGNAAGVSLLAQLAGFLLSPFNLLLLPFGGGQAVGMLNLVVLLKLSAAAFTAAWFFTAPHTPFVVGRALGGMLGTLWALGGFALGAAGDTALLELCWLIPLVAQGLCTLAVRGRPAPFTAALAVLLLTSGRFAPVLLLGLFVCAAFWLLLCKNKAVGGQAALRFVGGLLAAALISAPAWLPYFMALGNGVNQQGLTTGQWGTRLFVRAGENELAALLLGGLACGGLVMVLAAGALRSRGVVCLLCCLGVTGLPLVLAPLRAFALWLAGGSAAYAVLPAFLGLLLLAAGLQAAYRRPQPKQNRTTALLLVLLCVTGLWFMLYWLLSIRYGTGGGESLRWLLFSLWGGAVVLAAIWYARASLLVRRGAFAVAMGLVVLGQAAFAALTLLPGQTVGIKTDEAYYALEGRFAVSTGGGAETLGATLGYATRIKNNAYYSTANEPGALGYGSIGTASPFTTREMLAAHKRLGYAGYGNELSPLGGTLISDYFLGIAGSVDAAGPLRISGGQAGGADFYTVEPAPAWQSIGTVTGAGLESLAEIPEGDRFAAQDWLYNTLFEQQGEAVTRYLPGELVNVDYETYPGHEDYYGVWKVDDTAEAWMYYTLEVGERESLYFDCFRFVSADEVEVVNDGLAVYVNGEELLGTYPAKTANGIVYLGSFEEETVEVAIRVWRSELCRSFGVAGVKYSTLTQLSRATNHANVDIGFAGVTATAEAKGGDLLVLALAYSDGYTATVNGKATTVHQVLDGYIAIQMEQGHNEVKLKVNAQPLLALLLLFAIGLGLAVLLWCAELPFQVAPQGLTPFTGRGRASAQAALPTRRAGSGQSGFFAWAGAAARLLVLGLGIVAALLLIVAPLGLWAQLGTFIAPGA